MDFVQGVFGGMMTIFGYGLLFAAAYKLIQIATILTEIRDHLKSQPRVPSISPLAGIPVIDPSDSASAYAEQLLRAVNAESQPSKASAPVEHV